MKDETPEAEVLRTTRRGFLAIAAASRLGAAPGGVEVEVIRPRNPFEVLLRDVEPGHDEFPQEKQAFEIAGHLKRLTATGSLPLAPDFQGISPYPLRYAPVAVSVSRAEYDLADAGFEAGLTKWLASLQPIRAARFFVLPEGLVRYEIASLNRYITGVWKQTWAEGLLRSSSPVEETVTSGDRPLFSDITGYAFRDVDSFRDQLRLGVPAWRARLDAATGIDVHGHNGIAVGDIDGDGRDEIYVCQPGGLPNRLYKVGGDGSFEDITEGAGVGVLDATSSALFVDFRNSGMQDLVALRPEGPLLFLNQGGGHFALKPGAFRFRTAPQGSFTGMAAADYDRDGRVDLYLCTYSFFRDQGQYRYPVPYYDARNGPANFLFHNELGADGSGAFIDATESAGLNRNNDRFSFAAAWCDYDGDGWTDLYVANDFGRKNLYKNERGKFRDVAAEAGVEDTGDGMSAAWFDYDGDGRPDLYVSNMWSDAGQRVVAEKKPEPGAAWRRHAKGNSLYRNRGDGTFEETGAAEGVEMGRWAWSSDGIDFDNDGVPEIFITAGMLTNESETDLESFFWRRVAMASPVSDKPAPAYENGWNALSSAVHGEYSEAGRQPNVFYVRRNGRYYDFSGVSGLDYADDSRAFAVTDLDGDGSADVVLKSRLGPQVRVLRNDSAGNRKAIGIRLRGVKSNRDAIGARVSVDGQVKFVQAGSGYLSQHTKTIYFGLGEALSARTIGIVWPSGEQQQFSDFEAGFLYFIEEGKGAAIRTAFSGRREFTSAPVKGENRPLFSDTWLLDPVPLPESLPRTGIVELSSDLRGERAEKYALLFRYLFDLHADLKLPLWLLADAEGRAHKICFARPDAGDLDFSRKRLPFAGRYYSPPKRNYAALGSAFYSAGHPDEALRYLELAPQNSEPILLAIGKIHLGAARWETARSYFNRAIALAPDSADGWNSLGAVEAGEGRTGKALECFERALKLRPGMSSALVNAGQAHAALGNIDAASRMFLRALEANPKDAAAANQMGELLVRQGLDKDAQGRFEQAIAARRDYVPAIVNLAALYLRAGQRSDAIAALRYGLQTAPDEEVLYLNLAGVYASAGETGTAREIIGQLLVRKPESANGRRALRDLESR